MKRLSLLLVIVLTALSVRAGDQEAKQAMRRATQYMMDVVSYKGGFVWSYLPDFSREWGELEAWRTMVWLQSPSTPDVGQVLLDAYHATGDVYYYESACKVARCIIHGQKPSGGWNYMFDYESEETTKKWYATIGRQAWRLEEFQHYYGNATFDDEATMHCAEFLLRIYLEKKDREFYGPLQKAIGFLLASQYDNGGWPQRYPLMYDHPFRGKADYSSFVTINDDVMPRNIEFLTQCYTSLGMKELKEPILRAMRCLRDLQQPLPLAGWADQYTVKDLKPAHARSYEPRAVNTGTTVAMIRQMIHFYEQTGDKSYLKGIPNAIQFLESVKLPSEWVTQLGRRPLGEGDIFMPRFIDPDTHKPMYVHRKGSNVRNGQYYTDSIPEGTIAHYSSFMTVNPSMLRKMLKDAEAMDQKKLERESPLRKAKTCGPQEYYYRQPTGMGRRMMMMPSVDRIIDSLDSEGRWLSVFNQISNPYKEIPATMPQDSEDRQYAQTMVGDEYDTSPFPNKEVKGISTRTYIWNMVALINSIRQKK